MLCFVVVMQSFIMHSREVFIHIHQGCFAGTGAIVRLPQCQWSKPDWYGKISQCLTTTKHSKAKTVCIFLGIYCINEYILTHLYPGQIRWKLSHSHSVTQEECFHIYPSCNLILMNSVGFPKPTNPTFVEYPAYMWGTCHKSYFRRWMGCLN